MFNHHFRNECVYTTGKFSCAIDTILELFYWCLFKSSGLINLVTIGPLMQLLQLACSSMDCAKSEEELRCIRNPVWNWCVDNIKSFAPKGTIDATLTDILKCITTTDQERNFFALTYKITCKCVSCDGIIDLPPRHYCPVYLYLPELQLNNYSVKATLASNIENPCKNSPIMSACKKCNIPQRTLSFVKNSVDLPQYLFCVLPNKANSRDIESDIFVEYDMQLQNSCYNLVGAVRSKNDHFTCAVKKGNVFHHIDDLNVNHVSHTNIDLNNLLTTRPSHPDGYISNGDDGFFLFVYARADSENQSHTTAAQSFNSDITFSSQKYVTQQEQVQVNLQSKKKSLHTNSGKQHNPTSQNLEDRNSLNQQKIPKSESSGNLKMSKKSKDGNHHKKQNLENRNALPQPKIPTSELNGISKGSEQAKDGSLQKSKSAKGNLDTNLSAPFPSAIFRHTHLYEYKNRLYMSITDFFKKIVQNNNNQQWRYKPLLALIEKAGFKVNEELIKPEEINYQIPCKSNGSVQYSLISVKAVSLFISNPSFYGRSNDAQNIVKEYLNFIEQSILGKHISTISSTSNPSHQTGLDDDNPKSTYHLFKKQPQFQHTAKLKKASYPQNRTIHNRVALQQNAISQLTQQCHFGSKESFKTALLYDVSKNVSVQKRNETIWDGHLEKEDLVDILQKVPTSSGEPYLHVIAKKKAADLLFLDSLKLINLIDTCNASELIGKLRSLFPRFIDTENNRSKTKKYLRDEFNAVMQPTRTPTGWRIDPMHLYFGLKQLYYWRSTDDWIKLWMDGREIGDRKSCAIAFSFINNDQKLNGIDFHSTDDIWPICLFYGGDDRWNLESNIGTSGGKPGWLDNWVQDLQQPTPPSPSHSSDDYDAKYTTKGPNTKVFLSADSACLDSIEGEAGELHPLSTFGFNMYSNQHKDTKQDYDKTTGRRSDLKKTIDRDNPNSLLPSIPLNRKVLCIDHCAARTVGKLVELRLKSIQELATSITPKELGATAAENSLANFKNNMIKRGVKKADQINIKTTEFKINKKDAHVLLAPPEKFINEYSPLLAGVASTTKNFTLCPELQKWLGHKDSQISEYALECAIWENMYLMHNTLRESDPSPTLKQGAPSISTDPTDYKFGLTYEEVLKYIEAADIFHRLFLLRYGQKAMTPYMIKMIDIVPELLNTLPVASLMRFATEQGEHLHYIQGCFYYQHTQRGGAYKTTDPNYEMLFWSFRVLRSRLVEYTNSSDVCKKNAGELFLNTCRRIWAATIFQKYWRGKLAATAFQKYLRGKLARKDTSDVITSSAENDANLDVNDTSASQSTNHKYNDIIIVGSIPTHLVKRHKSKENIIQKIKETGVRRVFTNFPADRIPKPSVKMSFTVVCDRSHVSTSNRKPPNKILVKSAKRGWNIVSFDFLDDLLSNKVASIGPHRLTSEFCKKYNIQRSASQPTHRHAGGPGSLLPYSELKRKKRMQNFVRRSKKAKIPKQPCGPYIQFLKDNLRKMDPSKSFSEKRQLLKNIWNRMKDDEKRNYARAARLSYELKKHLE